MCAVHAIVKNIVFLVLNKGSDIKVEEVIRYEVKSLLSGTSSIRT